MASSSRGSTPYCLPYLVAKPTGRVGGLATGRDLAPVVLVHLEGVDPRGTEQRVQQAAILVEARGLALEDELRQPGRERQLGLGNRRRVRRPTVLVAPLDRLDCQLGERVLHPEQRVDPRDRGVAAVRRRAEDVSKRLGR